MSLGRTAVADVRVGRWVATSAGSEAMPSIATWLICGMGLDFRNSSPWNTGLPMWRTSYMSGLVHDNHEHA